MVQRSDRRVVAVVPTFNPPPGLASRLRGLREDVDGIVVADDGSGPASRGVLDEIEQSGIPVIRSNRNTGIAAALNRGVGAATALGPSHVITIDQDSVLGAGYVGEALAAFDLLEAAGATVLAVGAGVIDGDPMPAPARFAGFPMIFETLQSGLVFRASALRTVGRFDESLFIDCVDTDMLLRGAAMGLNTFLAPGCRLQHQLGDTREAALLGKRLRFAYHAPVRRYYITRNRALVKARFARRFPRWAAVQLRDQTRFFAYCLLFGPDRGQQLLATTVGMLHAVTGQRGIIPPRLAGLLAAR